VVTGSVDTNTVGTYTISYDVTDTNGNVATTVTRTINVVDSLSIDNNDEIKLSIFPNPTSTSWQLKTKTIITSISLYDITGRKVFHDNPNNKDVEINAEFLPSGLYFLVVNRDTTLRLIKN
jgi:hypothetical protein